MTVIASKVEVLAGIPLPAVREQVAAILIGPLLPFVSRVYEGPKINTDTGLEPLGEFMVKRPNFSARGRRKFEAVFHWPYRVTPRPSLGRLATYIKYGTVATDVLLDAAIETAKLVDAPIAYLDLLNERAYRERVTRHRRLYQEGRSGADVAFDLSRGFSGIPWRTILGHEFVRYFGGSKLSALPASLAQQIDDEMWLLTPCETPEEWSADSWCEGEREIIAALGAESFFDPQSGTLATRTPAIPPVSTLPVKLLTPEATSIKSGPFETFNGYLEP